MPFAEKEPDGDNSSARSSKKGHETDDNSKDKTIRKQYAEGVKKKGDRESEENSSKKDLGFR
jgi:hypothetical protein